MKKEIIACALLLVLIAGCVCNIRYLDRLCTQLDDAAAQAEARCASHDADSAADRMLEAGESLFFELSGRILQAHVNENGVLSCLILRDAMPEDLY